MPSKADILRSYRELLYLIKNLPKDSRLKALTEARDKVRENKHVQGEDKASELHKLLTSKIGFLRLSQPRKSGDKYAKSGVFVLRDGVLVEGSAQRESRLAS